MRVAISQELLDLLICYIWDISGSCTIQSIKHLLAQFFQSFDIQCLLLRLFLVKRQQGIKTICILLECILIHAITIQALIYDLSLNLSLCVAVEVHAHVGRNIIIAP